MTPRTVLIGLDGATFTVLDPFIASGIMPFLRDFTAGAVRAPLRSVIPALTPPSWTSLMSGKRPGQHGVFDFFQKESPDSHYFRFAGSQDIGSATVWSLASGCGQRVISLNFPLMFPPPAINGSVVPGGWMPWRQLRLGCHPPGLFDRLKMLPSFNARELALDMRLEEKALEGCAVEEYAEWIALHTRRERRWFDILHYLMREEAADLIGILFDGVDKLQHLCWRFLDPSCQSVTLSAWEREIRGLCEAYFRQLDELIAEIVSLVGPEANVILASDHGFGPTTDVFYLNTWLEQQGYLAWAGNGAVQKVEAPQLGIGQITRHVYQLDWERTIAYAATPSSNGIHIVGRSSNGAGVPPEQYLQVRQELSGALRRIRHPSTGEPIVTEVWSREEAFSGPYQSLAPDLTITLADGGNVSILRSDAPVKPRPEPVGAHRPEGIFLANGPDMRAGVALPELSIVDVASLLLYCQDVTIPSDLASRLPVEVFEPAALERRPPRMAMATLSSDLSAAAPAVVLDPESEAIMLKRLRALGYVE